PWARRCPVARAIRSAQAAISSAAGAGGVGPAAVAIAAQTAMADTRAAASSYADAFAAWERQFLIDALAASNGKVTEAAARIGIGRATFYKKLATLGIDT
ncbi:helix-turn-helix domain-containing protein, partial [Burkholderia pseudomallei]|uniref:helix-turn-helix domain-containing protein n=1 Tax=Burkholderia pseudomallei TaxID=28450 RepID=UPI00274295FA